MATRLLLGDCLDLMRTLPDASVDAVVTDPPYGTGQWQRAESGCGGDCRAVQITEEWDRWSTSWLDDAWRVSRGCVGLFLAAREIGSLLEWVGSRPWRMFVWVKSDPRPRFQGQPAYGFDPFVVIGKVQPAGGKDYIVASSPRLNRDKEATGHPHQKRLDVMRWCLGLTCPVGGLVLDPFMGSGTTGVACVQEGRRFIGIEREASYYQIAERRIAAAQPPLFAEVAD